MNPIVVVLYILLGTFILAFAAAVIAAFVFGYNRLYGWMAGAVAVALFATCGPWAITSFKVWRVERASIAASYWPDDLDFSGQTIQFVDLNGGGYPECTDLCREFEEVLPWLNGNRRGHSEGDTDHAPIHYLAGRELADAIAALVNGQTTALSEYSISLLSIPDAPSRPATPEALASDFTIVQTFGPVVSGIEAENLSLPSFFDGRPAHGIHVFEGNDFWDGNVPIARMVAVRVNQRPLLFPLFGENRFRPEGCDTYTEVWRAWLNNPNAFGRGRFRCQRIFH